MALPDTYKQVEYIASNWKQYIDTWIFPSNNMQVETSIEVNGTEQNIAIFWCAQNSTWDSSSLWNRYHLTAFSNKFYYWLNNWEWNAWSYSPTLWTKYTIIFNNSSNQLIVNGSSIATVTGTVWYSWTNLNISRRWNSWNYKFWWFKYFYFKIYNKTTGEYVRDMVPAIRKSDNKPGMYDLINNVFYTNAWTGEFEYPAQFWKITHIYLGTNLIRPKKQSGDFYYSDDNWNEYQSLVSSVWSVQLVDTWKRYRFNCACYIWNRVAVNVDWTNLTKVNLDTLTVVSTKPSSISGKIWYFGDNRILTRSWIMDFDGNMITTFSTSYRMITPWLPWVVWANDDSYNMYKGIVNWDNVTFTKVWTSTSNSWIWASPWDMLYWRLWAYSSWNTENSTQYIWFYNVSTWTFSTITASMWSQHATAWWVCMPDWKIYKHAERNLWWWRLYRVWTSAEWVVWNSLSTGWGGYWNRAWKFLWNIISWWMNSNNGTGTWYWTNNYFINSSWTVTLVQSNALAYDSTIYSTNWFVDENWWLYLGTGWWGSGAILKTDKTFTDFHWWNPYLYR